MFTYECLCIYIHVAIHINLWGEHTHMLHVPYQNTPFPGYSLPDTIGKGP